jgi:hypothetical protein
MAGTMSLSDKAAARRLRLGLFADTASITPDHPNYQSSMDRHEQLSKSKKYRKILKAAQERAELINVACQLNGPGIFADTYVRNFLLEYNNRVFKGLGLEQPTSFNIMREFIEPDEQAFVLKLLEEKIYQCNLSDYLDFITSSADIKNKISPSAFEELKIYEINNIGSFSQILLPGFGELVFCGAAMVREQAELSIIGIFGDRTSNYTPVAKIEPTAIPASKRKLFENIENKEDSSQSLFENEDYYPLLALTRIDLDEMAIQVQYLLRESKESFRVITDDPTIYYDFSGQALDDDIKAIQKRSAKELAENHHVFDFLYHLIHFPSFCERYEDDFYLERHPTQIKIESDLSIVRKIKEKLEVALRPTYREVATLAPRSEPQESHSIERMNLRRETSGFWKTLPQDKFGTDKNGNKVQGKTWVTKDLTWNEGGNNKPIKAEPIIVSPADLKNVGFLYIMKSPAHERHVYKIGFTNRNPEERADDLSSSSGQPDFFVVVQSWQVIDAKRVERAVHRQLRPFRLADRREFFKIKFEEVRKIIEETITSMRASASQS